jgi:hypothetical protein
LKPYFPNQSLPLHAAAHPFARAYGDLIIPDARHQTPDIREQTPDTRRQTPDIRHQTSDTSRLLYLCKKLCFAILDASGLACKRGMVMYGKVTQTPNAEVKVLESNGHGV